MRSTSWGMSTVDDDRSVPPIRLRPEPIDPDTTIGFKYAGPEPGHRHRIGGEPSFRPDPWPRCSCDVEMTFYGQLDSLNDEITLADVGVLLVFVCFDCFEAAAMVGSS